MMKPIKRGDIFIADLKPVIGSEQGGIRPVLILQNNIGNQYSKTVIVTVISGRAITKAKLPTHVLLESGRGLMKESIVMLEQIRTIDKSRLQAYIGYLNHNTMKKVDEALCISMGLYDMT